MSFTFKKQIDNEGKTGIDIEVIMNTWTNQAGYPVVKINKNK